MKVSGIVSKVQSDHVTVKTAWGQMVISSATAPKNLKVGEEVEMQVSENNAVIDVHRKGDKGHSHRFVTGNLTYASPDHKEIKLWTPEGEKTLDVQSGRSQLSAFQEGAPVTLELNEAGKVIDIHKMTVEMAFDEPSWKRKAYERNPPPDLWQVDPYRAQRESGQALHSGRRESVPAGAYGSEDQAHRGRRLNEAS